MSKVPLYGPCHPFGPGLWGLGLQLLHINEKRFRGGLVFQAHKWLYYSTLGSRVIKEKKKVWGLGSVVACMSLYTSCALPGCGICKKMHPLKTLP